MHSLKHSDDLFMDESSESHPPVSLTFDSPESANISLFSDEPREPSSVIQLFPEESRLFDDSDDYQVLEQPIIRLLPDNPSEEAVLRLRVQLLEAKLARQNAQEKFAERIDVDHLDWKLQKSKMAQLQVGNFLLIMLSLALMVCAGCLAVIRM